MFFILSPSYSLSLLSFCGVFWITDLLPLTLGSPDTLILVAEPGDDVTIWYQREKTTATYVYWFKHTDSSVPFYVGCQFYSIFSPPSLCYFGNQSKRMVMSVNSQNTSLTITAVNHTDTGLYYCGIMQSIHISFSNETYLQVKGFCANKTLNYSLTKICLIKSDYAL
uniref:Ig-like domain-containing protein n=1 Tax=Electrophorus electricus TaxID=8005 RepID=A0A4W4G6J9_ELEEL